VRETMRGVDRFAFALAQARAVCLSLPEVYEEQAWVGRRWRIRTHTFAHVLEVLDGQPRSFALSSGTDGPATLLTLRVPGADLGAVLADPSCFGPLWRRTDVGVRIDEQTDWDELAELIIDSYRMRAPKNLLRLLDD
jgi:hypothetical protein